MQRSRKALLERRAIEKAKSGRNYLYKVSLSLVFVLWGLVFLFSLWISRGHGYRGIIFVSFCWFCFVHLRYAVTVNEVSSLLATIFPYRLPLQIVVLVDDLVL